MIVNQSTEVNIDNKQEMSELQQRINNLTSLSGLDLRHEMDNVKATLLENPAACALLVDEDIGKCVAALRIITGTAIEESAKKERKPRLNKKLTKEELEEGLDDM